MAIRSGAGAYFLTAEAPRVTMDPDRQSVNEGTSGTIRCLVTGQPAPVITWSRARGSLGRNHQVCCH